MLPQPVSVTTVRRHLREAGLIAKKIVKRPALKQQYINGRLQFVRKYKEWTMDDWTRVIWSDESKINRIYSDGLRYVWDDAPGEITSRSVQVTVKFGGGGVSVWLCMSWNGAIVKGRNRGIRNRDKDWSSNDHYYYYATSIYIQLENLGF